MVKKFTESKVIVQFIQDYNKAYYLRELAALLKKSHQAIKPYVESLVKERILVKNKKKGVTEYSLNFKNPQVYEYIIIAEKKRLLERLQKDILFKVLYEKLFSSFSQNTFIIFGSSVEKLDKRSDIDILVVGEKKNDKTVNEFEAVYNKKVHKVQINSIEKLTPALTQEIYKKHLIFNNTEQIIRFFGELHEQNRLV